MSSVYLKLCLQNIFSKDISKIIFNYTIIICDNCLIETNYQIITERYNKCNGWLCKKCDNIIYSYSYSYDQLFI